MHETDSVEAKDFINLLRFISAFETKQFIKDLERKELKN